MSSSSTAGRLRWWHTNLSGTLRSSAEGSTLMPRARRTAGSSRMDRPRRSGCLSTHSRRDRDAHRYRKNRYGQRSNTRRTRSRLPCSAELETVEETGSYNGYRRRARRAAVVRARRHPPPTSSLGRLRPYPTLFNASRLSAARRPSFPLPPPAQNCMTRPPGTELRDPGKFRSAMLTGRDFPVPLPYHHSHSPGVMF